MKTLQTDKMNKMVDLTLLKPTTNRDEMRAFIKEAIAYDPKSICINPTWIRFAINVLENSEYISDDPMMVCTVIGFPLGANTTNVKVKETLEALSDGADEIDYVINIGDVKSGLWNLVKFEAEEIMEVCKDSGAKAVKVILETCYLNTEEIVKCCEIMREVGVDFVKTSTGFGTGGATVADVALMHKVFGGDVKASGGIRDLATAQAMIEAGATRLGTSAKIGVADSVDAY
jgi:deoxyribose-phosphate aldolase